MKEPICEDSGTLVIKEIKFCGEIISFNHGQELQIKYSKYEGEDFITVEYDFGMTSKESLDIDHNWLLNGYRDLDKNYSIRDIAEKTALYDIEHAFCHPSCDPNYGPEHWAIQGWLKDRIIIKEDPDFKLLNYHD